MKRVYREYVKDPRHNSEVFQLSALGISAYSAKYDYHITGLSVRAIGQDYYCRLRFLCPMLIETS